jgi:hypothetical protein
MKNLRRHHLAVSSPERPEYGKEILTTPLRRLVPRGGTPCGNMEISSKKGESLAS